jgi:hypothetical protein
MNVNGVTVWQPVCSTSVLLVIKTDLADSTWFDGCLSTNLTHRIIIIWFRSKWLSKEMENYKICPVNVNRSD